MQDDEVQTEFAVEQGGGLKSALALNAAVAAGCRRRDKRTDAAMDVRRPSSYLVGLIESLSRSDQKRRTGGNESWPKIWKTN
jgi:hypothetical protein